MNPGDIKWTCNPSIEAEQYGGGATRPYQVKLEKGPGSLWFGHGFDEQTGAIDDDTNATCYIYSRYDVFDTHKEACDFYDRLQEGISREAMRELESFREYRKELGV